MVSSPGTMNGGLHLISKHSSSCVKGALPGQTWEGRKNISVRMQVEDQCPCPQITRSQTKRFLTFKGEGPDVEIIM